MSSSNDEEALISSTTTLTSTTDAEIPENKTPRKKRTYKNSIYHGISSKLARYHKVTPDKRRYSKTSLSSIPKSDGNQFESNDISNIQDDFRMASSLSETDDSDDEFTNQIYSSLSSSTMTSCTATSDSDSDSQIFDSVSFEEDNILEDDNIEVEEISDINKPLYEGCRHTKFSAYSMIMLFITKRGLCREGFTEMLEIISDLLPPSTSFTTSVYMVKETLKTCINFQEPITHHYCESCQDLLENENQCDNDICQRNETSKTLEFCDLNLLEQLKEMFKDENFLKLILKQRNLHVDSHQNLEDVTLGKRYREIVNTNNKADINLTFTMNTDGVALFTSSKKGSLWPVYIAINELPVKVRFSRKYLIPCYLHCQVEKPNMLTYLTPLMRTLHVLHESGLEVQSSIGKLIVKGHLLIASVDLPAKALVANVKQFNGRFSCTMCKDEGKNPPGNPMLRFFPFNQQSEVRTHQSWIEDARNASEQGNAIHGIKGVCAAMMLPYVKLPELFVIDWMHSVLLGVTKTLMTLWFDNKYKDKDFFVGNKMALMDKRYLNIKIPDFVSRTQRTLTDHKHWKASECREWLVHFSVPVLHGILSTVPYVHYLLLVTGIAILTSDELKAEEVDEAENLLLDFCRVFPKIYGNEKQTMNIHLVKHLAENARMYGPLYGYSCFGFESMNSFIKNMVHGTRHINKQISFAVGMSKQLTSIVKKFTTESVDPRTKNLFRKLGSKLIQEENIHESDMESLGRKSVMKETSPYYILLSEEMKENHPKTFGRLRSQSYIFKSKDYQHAKTRCDFICCYDSENETRIGIICSFIEVEDRKYAVVQKCETTPFSLSQHVKRAITERYLKENAEKPLCKHVHEVVTYGDVILISADKLRKKCISIKVKPNLTFLYIRSSFFRVSH